MMPIQTKVAIVGGGLAGLHAARALHAAGVGFLLFEARDRLGGRILSVDEAGQASDDGFDLGASWFWPAMQPAVAALVEELGLASFAQSFGGDVIFERMSRETPQRYRPVGNDPQSMRLAGGTAALVRALAGHLPRASLQLGSRVTVMTLHTDGVRLTVAREDGSSEAIVADQVVAAVPPRLLEALVSFDPPVDAATAKRWRSTETWMAPHAKFFAVYDRPFWREAGLSGTAQSFVGPMGEIHDATTGSGTAALLGFLGVGADHRAAMGETALTETCLGQLTRLFGAEARHPRRTLIKDWAADPWTATAGDRSTEPHPTAEAALWVTHPWHDRLQLASSETSLVEPGFMAGAIEAARAAAAEVLAKLGR
jgi:monoamine oxidase